MTMRLIGHFAPTTAVVVVVGGLIGGAMVVAHERADTATSDRASVSVPAAKRKPDLRLTTTARSVTAGERVTLRIRTSTKHRRPVRVQRWDPSRKKWRRVVRRGVRGTASVRVTPPVGTSRYRAFAPRVCHRAGGTAHTHRAARSVTVRITARARTAPTRPVRLSADESALLTKVTEARHTYARPIVRSASNAGADACLTSYARSHLAWMIRHGRALDPGSAEHRSAGRSSPAVACPGHTVTAVTRAVGTAGSTSAAIDHAIDAWLSSAYGETARVLSACHDAPAFEFGVATTTAAGARWFTVLIASDTRSTTASGACR